MSKRQSGLPKLSDVEIDRIAEECAHDFFPEMFEHPQPVCPANFIEFGLGYDLDYLYLSNCQLYLGMTCFKNIAIPVYNAEAFKAEIACIEAGTVIIDSWLYMDAERSGHHGRLRFTQAHEAGHCVLHSEFFLKAAQRVGDQKVARGACHSVFLEEQEAEEAEHQADMFASCFLIPLGSLKTLFDQFQAWRWEDEDLISLVKETFDVSWPAAFYRLQKLGWLSTDSIKYDRDEFSGG